MTDKITAIHVFLMTVRHGSVSAAATHLDMSRAMASRHVAFLEEWTGARLLHRTTRRLSLTSAGESIIPLFKEMLALAENAETLVSSAKNTPQGLIRITASSIFAQTCLTDIIMEFIAQYPLVSIDLMAIDNTVNLVEERIDLAIRISNDLDPNLIARKLGVCHSVLCASPEYLAQYGCPTHPEQLTKHNCLTYSYFGKSIWQLSKDSEPFTISVSGNLTANEAMIIRHAAIKGVGIAILPTFAIEEQIKQGKLVAILSDYHINDLAIYAVYASRKYMSKSHRTLIDFLSEKLAKIKISATQ